MSGDDGVHGLAVTIMIFIHSSICLLFFGAIILTDDGGGFSV